MLSTSAERPPGSAADCATKPGAEMIAVRLEGVSKHFGEISALDDVTLAVRRGELLSLLGPSGCGKTTLLNLIAGFLVPDSGEIAIAGERVTFTPTYRREIGFMFQSYALFPHMSVAANVGYGLRMRGVAKAEIARRVVEALALVKLSGLEDRKPRQLSGGQQQRVALARALVIRPRVLLLDEPLSALDRNLRAAMQIEIKEIQRKLGVTTVFVTHDQSEALSLSDRIAVMAHGRIRQLGTAQEVYRAPNDRFVASFVGDVNVLRTRLVRIEGASADVLVGEQRVTVSSRTLQDAQPGASVDLFVRPEDLRVAEGGAHAAVEGTVAAQIYQGGHVDLHIEAPEMAAARVLIRLAGHEGMTQWPVGARIGITLAGDNAVAFKQENA
jgi:putative spermidine/putrescine transport system ATP-binding protein/spermidine/putrescine transport system ATP-binding protein